MGRFRSLAVVAAILAITIHGTRVWADGCPKEPDWSYTLNDSDGPDKWNSLFPIQCGNGTRQSPFAIVTANTTRANLPKLVFHYNVADVVVLDHDDQVQLDHGAGNFITIGKTRYDLYNVHEHTPGEYRINGNKFPMEIHLVHKNPETGQVAVVGVMVKAGKADKGVIEPPSSADPSAVDLKLTDLIPKKRNYVRFNGSLTTPGTDVNAPRCAEGLLWTEMLTPITMSPEQIAAFEDAAEACWGTKVTNRPLQPLNSRFVLRP